MTRVYEDGGVLVIDEEEQPPAYPVSESTFAFAADCGAVKQLATAPAVTPTVCDYCRESIPEGDPVWRFSDPRWHAGRAFCSKRCCAGFEDDSYWDAFE